MRKLGLWVSVTASLLLCAPMAAKPFAPTKPQRGAQIRLLRPTLVFAGDLPAGVARDTLRLFVDDDDLTEFTAWDEGRLRITCPLPLEPGEHTAKVVVAGAKAEAVATLSFTVVAPGAAAVASGRFTDSVELESTDREGVTLALQPHIDGRLVGPLGNLGYDITLEHQLGFNGDDGDLQDPDAILEFERPGFAASLGTIANPYSFSESEFLGVTAYRRALDAKFGKRSPLSLFSNLADALPTVAGERGFEQQIHGASWQLPIRGDRLRIRLLGLSAEDRKAPTRPSATLSRPENARLLGALVSYRWNEKWETLLELATSDREVDEAGTRTSARDQAWRVELDGSMGDHKLNARLARVGGRFANPADPRLTLDREEAEVRLSRRAKRWNYRVHWRLGSDGLEEGVRSSDEERYSLTLGRKLGRKLGGIDASIDWSQQTITSARANSKQTRVQLRLSRGWKHWRVDLQGVTTDNERSGYGFSSTEQDSIKGSWRWSSEGNWTFRGSLGGAESRRIGRTRETRDLFVESAWRATSGRLRAAFNKERAHPALGPRHSRLAPGRIERLVAEPRTRGHRNQGSDHPHADHRRSAPGEGDLLTAMDLGRALSAPE